MHANQWSLEQAARFASSNTPRGWLRLDGETVWFEQHLYLQQPGYGTSYVMGKLEVDQLITASQRALGRDFTLRRFMDDLDAAGMVPITLLRWELTGDSDRVPGVGSLSRGTTDKRGSASRPPRGSRGCQGSAGTRAAPRRHLHPDQHASRVGAVVPVVEQADVPIGPHPGEELEQRARTLGEVEPVDQLVARERGMPADQVAHVQLRHLVVGQVEGAQPVPLQGAHDPAVSSRLWMPTPTNTCASLASAMR